MFSLFITVVVVRQPIPLLPQVRARALSRLSESPYFIDIQKLEKISSIGTCTFNIIYKLLRKSYLRVLVLVKTIGEELTRQAMDHLPTFLQPCKPWKGMDIFLIGRFVTTIWTTIFQTNITESMCIVFNQHDNGCKKQLGHLYYSSSRTLGFFSHGWKFYRKSIFFVLDYNFIWAR